MPTSFKRLELLEQQIYHAHRAAVGEELDLRGLREVNPLILAMLKHVEQAGAESFLSGIWRECWISRLQR